MKTEIEVKFLDVDFDDIRRKISELGGTCEHHMRLMKRAILDTPDLKMRETGGYIRVRDEGNTVTLTYKQFDKTKDLHIASAKELEVEVSNFDDTVGIMLATGLAVRSIQESKRETWRLEGVEIVLDEWPWLNPYIEIEAHSEEAVKKVAARLGFDWKDAVFGDVMVAYRKQYPYLTKDQTVGRVKEVRFNDSLPDLLKNHSNE
jgi:adenylate cyclase class 2